VEYDAARPLPRLYVSVLAELDRLTAIEFDQVDDGQPEGELGGGRRRIQLPAKLGG